MYSGCETSETLTRKRIKSVERSLLETVSIKGMPLKKMELPERMSYYRVPGISLAVIDNYQIEWAKAYGIKKVSLSDPVTTETLFQAGELSQPVAALAVLSFVEKGILNLDEDINRYLTTWKIKTNRNTRKTPVSLRHLLSHSSGANLPVLPGYKQGKNLPTIQQVLNGKKPASNPPLNIDFEPGLQVRFSWGGYAILQLLLSEFRNDPFTTVLDKTVLTPLKMSHSTFAATPPVPLEHEAASGHLREGQPLEGKWLNYPAQAASGLWTTPTDMANFALAVINTAMGKTQSIISPQTARTMLTPQAGNQGLGFSVDDIDDNLNINIKGGTEGFQTYIILYPQKGQGAVLMTNSANGQFLIEEMLRSISLTYEWPHFQPNIKPLYRLDPSIYQQYVGRYEVNPDYILTVTYEDYYLIIQPSGQSPTKFYVENHTTFFSTSPYIQIFFNKDAQNRVISLTLRQAGQEQEAKKIREQETKSSQIEFAYEFLNNSKNRCFRVRLICFEKI
jgi:CubicO group peptidase (beta-lactamase class C family)